MSIITARRGAQTGTGGFAASHGKPHLSISEKLERAKGIQR
jgi:hypothetical protein